MPDAVAEVPLPPAIANIRASNSEVADKAIWAASSLWQFLRGALLTPNRVYATRAGTIACSFSRERKYAILECDEDVILTLTDRSRDTSGDNYQVVTSELFGVPSRIQRFLEG